jgi:predicted RNase H-like HicB family nuclease
MYYVFPAVFTPRDNKDGFIVKVPDIPGCVTEGKDLTDAARMIKDAMCGCLCVLEEENIDICPASIPSNLSVENNEFIALIDADTTEYRLQHENKSVRKNVSLPAWLNAKAEQARINCSQLLQEALREKLGV